LGGDARTQSIALHTWRRGFVKRSKGASSGENALHLCIACGDSRRAVPTKVRSGIGQGMSAGRSCSAIEFLCGSVEFGVPDLGPIDSAGL
jgi:hypothetical protein